MICTCLPNDVKLSGLSTKILYDTIHITYITYLTHLDLTALIILCGAGTMKVLIMQRIQLMLLLSKYFPLLPFLQQISL
jgi:hypothetical protein